jgi:serine/threonine protein kinase
MEPPSPTLAAALRDLRLASPRDLKRAGGRCRAIARDLPAFDCVWIDALLGLKRITPFQAQALQSGEAGRLRVGRYVLLDRLSRGCDGETFLARPLAGGPKCVVKTIECPTERRERTLDSLRGLVERGRSVKTPHVVVPHEVFEEGSRIVLVSRAAGENGARSLLVRQGRLAGTAVAEIARQLLGGLAELHRAGLVHGEVRLANLRLTARGEAVLVDAGARPASSPVLVIDDARPPDWYDGSAPERIGTAAPPTAASDVYALGCLLWHLLAGRPTFATGGPLAKLAAHRLRLVPDVRDFSPDAPEELVRLVREMTDPDPEARPACGGVRHKLRRAVRSKRTVRTVARGTQARANAFPWPMAAALLFALSGASLWLADREAASALLRMTLGREPEVRSTATAMETPPLAALPSPDPSGVLLLEHPGPFAAADVSFRGRLTIRGNADSPATIVVKDRPFHLWAEELALENVRIVYERPVGSAGGVPALVLAEAQNLTVQGCRFECPVRPAAERPAAPAAVAWRLIDRADPTAGRLAFTNSVCRGARELVYAADAPRRAAFDNVLGVGLRSLIALGIAGRCGTEIGLKRVTLREAASVVAGRAPSALSGIEIAAEDSILALGLGGSLVSGPEENPPMGYRWSGSGVITTTDVAELREGTKTADAVGLVMPSVEGVTRAKIAFAGPAEVSDAASVARVTGAPRIAGRVPGIDLTRLPRESPGAAR